MKYKFFSNLILILLLNVVIKPLYILGIDAEILKITEYNNPGAYGTYFSLLNLTFIFNIILDLGINNFNTRNIAQNNQLFTKHFSKIFTLKITLSIIYLIVLIGVGYFLNYRFKELKWLFIIGFNQVLVAIILYIRSNLSALLQFKKDGLLSVADRLVLILFCGYFIWGINNSSVISIEFFIYSQTFAYLLTILIGLIFLFKHSSFPKLLLDPLFFKLIIKKSFPYALLIFLMSIYYYSDVVMVEKMLDNIEVVSYAHGYRFFLAVNMIGYLFAGLLLPIFSKLIKDQKSIQPISWLSFKTLFMIALIISVSIWSYKSQILNWRYEITGFNLEHSSDTFGWLMISFIAVSCNYIFGTLLTANGSLKSLNIIAALGIFINISLNLLLIPKWGSEGASFASALTQFFILISQIFFSYKYFHFTFYLKSSLQIIFSTAFLFSGAYIISHKSPLIWEYNLFMTFTFGIFIGIALKIFNWKELLKLFKASKP